MPYFDASIRDQFRKKKRLEVNPNAAFKAHVRSTDAVSLPNTPTQPHEGLLQDPMLELAKASERFQDFQVSSGMEIIRSGVEPQTAAELDNVRAAQEQLEKGRLQNKPEMMPPPPLHSPYGQPGFLEPFNNPFSTVPGGMPAYNPFGPGPMPGM